MGFEFLCTPGERSVKKICELLRADSPGIQRQAEGQCFVLVQ